MDAWPYSKFATGPRSFRVIPRSDLRSWKLLAAPQAVVDSPITFRSRWFIFCRCLYAATDRWQTYTLNVHCGCNDIPPKHPDGAAPPCPWEALQEIPGPAERCRFLLRLLPFNRQWLAPWAQATDGRTSPVDPQFTVRATCSYSQTPEESRCEVKPLRDSSVWTDGDSAAGEHSLPPPVYGGSSPLLTKPVNIDSIFRPGIELQSSTSCSPLCAPRGMLATPQSVLDHPVAFRSTWLVQFPNPAWLRTGNGPGTRTPSAL